MSSVTVTVKSKAGLVVPPSVRRQAGIKPGDQLEFRASRGVITIVTKSNNDAEHTTEQRRMIDREIAKGLDDVRNGRIHGPYTASEAEKFVRTELKTRAKKSKPK